MDVHHEPKRAALSSYGGGGISLNGLNRAEEDILEGAFRTGHHWVRMGQNGRIEHTPSFNALPSPADDDRMLPFWREGEKKPPVQLELFSHAETGDQRLHSSRSFTIQHLCGYGYTPEKYKAQAALLESWGFECLRSRRGKTGEFWEIWFLPGVWAAKGSLKTAVHRLPQKERNEETQAKLALEFIRRNASFGTLDVSVQRLAQVLDD
ncbi:hypothetical protein K2Q00_03330 [Patescibacteria group bacterium]|nr:hypothetical protein [Patescibacteria group bacterium]